MNVAVCVKQIPNADTPPALDPNTKTLVRTGPLILDDSDSYGVEIALRCVEQAGGGEVTLISIAPDDETAGLRTALAMGADKAILVSDARLQGLDALGTAKVLSAAIRRSGADLVIAATESTDGYTGTVPVQVAELLGYPALSFAKHVEVKDGSIEVQRQTEDGFVDVSCATPAIVTVTAGVVEVRYPSFKGIVSAKTKPIDRLTIEDLGLDASELGTEGARQEVVTVEQAQSREQGNTINDDGEGYLAIISALESWKAI